MALAVADQAGQGLGADGGPHGDQLGVDRMVVQAPDAVLQRQVGLGREGGQHVVEQGGGTGDVAGAHQFEDRVEVGGQGREAGHVGRNELCQRRRVDGQHLPERRRRVVGESDGKLVHQVDGGEHAGIGITV